MTDWREPSVISVEIRDSYDDSGFPCFSLECIFDSGEKFAPIQVDGDYPKLANLIKNIINNYVDMF
jgi:hypothetical protein